MTRLPSSSDRPALFAVELDRIPPLPNVTRRQHFHERSDSAKTWRGAAHLKALQALREHPHPEDFPLRSALVELLVTSPHENIDPDNVIAACKPIFDGITDAGVWKSDSFRTIGRLSVSHEKGEPGIRVTVLMGSVA